MRLHLSFALGGRQWSDQIQGHGGTNEPRQCVCVGEKLIDIDIKNTVINALGAKVKALGGTTVWEAATEFVRIIYNCTPRDSRARRFMVDLRNGEARNLKKEDDLLSNFLLFDLAWVHLPRIVKKPVSRVRCK